MEDVENLKSQIQTLTGRIMELEYDLRECRNRNSMLVNEIEDLEDEIDGTCSDLEHSRVLRGEVDSLKNVAWSSDYNLVSWINCTEDSKGLKAYFWSSFYDDFKVLTTKIADL